MSVQSSKPVCLIVTPSVFLLDERVFMSLGILKVAAVLENKGIPVEMVDLSGVANYEEAIAVHAKSSEATRFGITATTPQMPAAIKIAKTIRRVRRDARIILGGPHVTLANAACKSEKKQGITSRASRAMKVLEDNFDVLVAGDGEEAVFLALHEEAPKLVDADEPKSALFLDNYRLNGMPFPARHLIDVSSYRYYVEGERALSLIAQLGCPFECGFCGGRSSPSFRRVRMRRSENIVEEMEFLHATYGVNGFMLYDDELNVNPKMLDLMRLIKKAQDRLGASWRLRGFIKSQLFTDEQAASMHEAGFRWILVGFESGASRILENINKRATCDENTECLEIARRHGLKVKALMSIGHPGESRDTIRDTHEWLLRVRPDDFDISIITTYPGTPYYDQAVPDPERPGVWVYVYRKTGDRLFAFETDFTEVAEYYKGNPDGGYQSFVFTDELSAEDLVKLRDYLERDLRERLSIPFNPGAAQIQFEHSMGQFGGRLPKNILKSTNDH